MSKSQFFSTQDFDLAAALLTAGVDYSEESGTGDRILSASNPRSSGGKTGVYLQPVSRDGVDAEALQNAYEDREADKELDRAIESLPINDALKRELLQLAQLSAMAYIRAAFQNRRDLERDAGGAEPLIEIARGGRSAIVPANHRSSALNRKLLAEFG